MINVLIVEDAEIIRELLIHIIGSDPVINIVGAVENGEEAIEAVERLRPDVITMDIMMPKMDGLEATKQIMRKFPTPIIIISGILNDKKEISTTFEAMQAGALAVFPKPEGYSTGAYNKLSAELIKSIKMIAAIPVVKKIQTGFSAQSEHKVTTEKKTPDLKSLKEREIKSVVIGASTGGPLVIKEILSSLPEKYPYPVFIVQHIADGFTCGFVDWLRQSTGYNVKLAEDGERIQPSIAYVAPDNYHMIIDSDNIKLSDDEPVNGIKPSVSVLFKSVLNNSKEKCVGILLSGMGKDGAKELKLMKEAGAITIVQDEKSAIVYGMPGEAVRLDGAELILTPGEISSFLNSLIS